MDLHSYHWTTTPFGIARNLWLGSINRTTRGFTNQRRNGQQWSCTWSILARVFMNWSSKVLLEGTQWRNEQFVFKTIRRQHDIFGDHSFRVLVIHHPILTREVGWAGELPCSKNTRYMRNETERLNPQKSVGGGDQRYSLCPGYEVSNLKCEIGSLYSHVPFLAEGEVYIVPFGIVWIPLQRPVCLRLRNLLGQCLKGTDLKPGMM